jgi:hypothetical protein
MALTPLPTAPSRTDPDTFSARSDAWVDAIPLFATELDALQVAVDASKDDAAASEVAAALSAATASSAAASAIAAAGATMWVSGTTYSLGAVVWSPINAQSYRRIVAGAGTTDPSADATNWTILGVATLPVQVVSGTTQTAVSGTHYVLTNVAATTLTLPASPVSGDTVAVTPANSLITNVIARNGNTIMGLSEDMTLDNADATITLRYLASTWRLI